MRIPPQEIADVTTSAPEAARGTKIELGVHTIPFGWDANALVTSQNEVRVSLCLCVCACVSVRVCARNPLHDRASSASALSPHPTLAPKLILRPKPHNTRRYKYMNMIIAIETETEKYDTIENTLRPKPA